MVEQTTPCASVTSGPFPPEPITIRPSTNPRQFWVEGVVDGETWEEQNIQFSGFFGKIGPHVFVAGPELLEALRELVSACTRYDEQDEHSDLLAANYCAAKDKAIAVIAKAEGRS